MRELNQVRTLFEIRTVGRRYTPKLAKIAHARCTRSMVRRYGYPSMLFRTRNPVIEQKPGDHVDLLRRHQWRHMSTMVELKNVGHAVALSHLGREVERQQIRMHPTQHRHRNLDGLPIGPQIQRLKPRQSESPGDGRITQSDR